MFLTGNIKLDGIYQTTLNENCMSVLFCISSFEVTSYKKLHDTAWFRWVLTIGLEARGKSSKIV